MEKSQLKRIVSEIASQHLLPEDRYLDFSDNPRNRKKKGIEGFAKKMSEKIPKDTTLNLVEIRNLVNEIRRTEQKAVMDEEILDPMINQIAEWGRQFTVSIRDQFVTDAPEESKEIVGRLNELIDKMEHPMDRSTGFRAAAILLPHSFPQKDDPNMDTTSYILAWSEMKPKIIMDLLGIDTT